MPKLSLARTSTVHCESLVSFGGYERATPGTRAKQGERRYYLFPYDWRQDNVEQAKGLERLIDAIRDDYGDPHLRVDIVAHSMGGLIARYYLRYGPVDVLDGMPSLVSLYGAKRVRKLILLGTPNFGAVSAFTHILPARRSGSSAFARRSWRRCPAVMNFFLIRWPIG